MTDDIDTLPSAPGAETTPRHLAHILSRADAPNMGHLQRLVLVLAAR
jgi:hypothetical protein